MDTNVLSTNRVEKYFLKPNAPLTQRYILELKQCVFVNVEDPSEVTFPEYGCTVRIFPDPEFKFATMYLSNIRSKFPGQGNADAVMKFLCKLADKHQCNILLFALSGDKQTKQSRLVDWFKKHGFEFKIGQMMRSPKK